jgi:hypothetical protein
VNIRFRPIHVTRVLLGLMFLLVMASMAGAFMKYGFGHGQLFGLVPLFDLLGEANVPTWFSSALLLLCALCLGTIAYVKRGAADPFARQWMLLGVIFLLLSLDETAQIHDLIDDKLQKALHPHGALYYPWVVPAAVGVLILAASYARFLFSLPRATRRLFVVAGVIYVGGALGMEVAAAIYDEMHGYDNPVTETMGTIEEAMEMLGAITFLHALMTYLVATAAALQIRIEHDSSVGALKTSDPASDTAQPLPGNAPESAATPQYPQSSERLA